VLQRVFGYGFVTGSRVLLKPLHHVGFGNAHNAYIETLVSLGLVGVMASLALTWHAAKQCFRLLFGENDTSVRDVGMLSASLVVSILIAGITSITFSGPQYLDLAVLLAGLVAGSCVSCLAEPAAPQLQTSVAERRVAEAS
jgi:O-antigen ligase